MQVLCFYYRHGLDAVLDGENELTPPLAAHLRHCSACRSYYEGQAALVRQLRAAVRDADGQELDAVGMAAQVLANLPGPAVRPNWHKTRRSRPEIYRRLTAAAALLFIAAGIAYLWLASQPEKPIPIPTSVTLCRVDKMFRTVIPPESLDKQWQCMVAAPLTDEVKGVVEEGKQAARFLMACLPIKPSEGRRTLD